MKRKRYRLADGDAGIEETVRHMIRLARRDATDPAIKKIVKGFDCCCDDCAVQDAFRYVVDNVPYIPDPKEHEFVVAPRYLASGQWPGGDCDDLSTLLATLLLALPTKRNRKVWMKTIAWRRWEYTHVYVMTELPSIGGKVIPLDPVMGHKGFGAEKQPVIRHKEYLV